jgi:hypothetical protein
LAAPQALSASQTAAQTTTGGTTTTAGGTTTGAGLPTPSTWWWQLNSSAYNAILKQTTGLAYQSNGLASFAMSIAQQLTTGPGGSTAGAQGAWFPTPQFAHLGLGNLGGGAGSVSAAAGHAGRVGLLSVPPSWAGTPVSQVTPQLAAVEDIEAAPVHTVAATGAPGNALLRGMPPGTLGRRSAGAFTHKYGFRYSVLTRPPSAG